MKGVRSGVQKLIKEENLNTYDVGCISSGRFNCKAGMESLPVNIDQLFVDIFYHFLHSSKRRQEFINIWCSLFTTEPEEILKHCPTRWLSLLRCVNRHIQQYDELKSSMMGLRAV